MHYLKVIAITHVIAGVTALVMGITALSTQKGKLRHNQSGKIYFYSMTYVFISAIILSTIRFIPFLFMISFLSYYGCFSGVRILKLKRLHKGQKAEWMDWLAGGITFVGGISFMIYGGMRIWEAQNDVLGWLSIFFGSFTINAAVAGVKPFIKAPQEGGFWYPYHLDGMIGSYIAASTAFTVTIGRMIEFNHWILWIGPALIGAPIVRYWKKRYKIKFGLA